MAIEIRRLVLNNILWLAGSIALAFVVWFFAVVQANPIVQTSFNNIAVQFEYDDGLIITNDPRDMVRVIIRAQQSVLGLLTREDIMVRADLRGRGPGLYTIPLSVEIARTAVADTQPAQITVQLERVEAQQKPVNIYVTAPPAVDYGHDDPVADVLQALVSGASGEVASVALVRADVDMSDRRSSFEVDVPLIAYDAQGQRVPDITVEPRTARVSVNIFQRDDVQPVSVRPNILVETLPRGYVLQSIRYEPQVVYLSGSPGELSALGGAISTEPVSLDGRTADFSISVPLALPSTGLLVLSDPSTITINVGITAQTRVLQLENIPLELVGVPAGFEVRVQPEAVSVVLNGPLTVREGITAQDVQALIDLSGAAAGTQERSPTILVKQGQVSVDTITILPPVINLTITGPTPTPGSNGATATPSPGAAGS